MESALEPDRSVTGQPGRHNDLASAQWPGRCIGTNEPRALCKGSLHAFLIRGSFPGNASLFLALPGDAPRVRRRLPGKVEYGFRGGKLML